MSTQNSEYYYEPIERGNCIVLYNADEQYVPNPIGYIRTCLSVFYSDGIFLEAIKSVLADHDGTAFGEVY